MKNFAEKLIFDSKFSELSVRVSVLIYLCNVVCPLVCPLETLTLFSVTGTIYLLGTRSK